MESESLAVIKLGVMLLRLLLRCKTEGVAVNLSYDTGRRFDFTTNKYVQEPAGWEIEIGGIAYNRLYPSLLEAATAGAALLEIVRKDES